MLTTDRVLDVAQFLLDLGKQRAQESKLLCHGGTPLPEVKAEINNLLKEAGLLADAVDLVTLIAKRMEGV